GVDRRISSTLGNEHEFQHHVEQLTQNIPNYHLRCLTGTQHHLALQLVAFCDTQPFHRPNRPLIHICQGSGQCALSLHHATKPGTTHQGQHLHLPHNVQPLASSPDHS